MVTPKQAAFLIAYTRNDIVRDQGWESPEASTWIECLCSTRADNAVFGSLLQAGIMVSNGESCHLTDRGREIVASLLK